MFVNKFLTQYGNIKGRTYQSKINIKNAKRLYKINADVALTLTCKLRYANPRLSKFNFASLTDVLDQQNAYSKNEQITSNNPDRTSK